VSTGKLQGKLAWSAAPEPTPPIIWPTQMYTDHRYIIPNMLTAKKCTFLACLMSGIREEKQFLIQIVQTSMMVRGSFDATNHSQINRNGAAAVATAGDSGNQKKYNTENKRSNGKEVQDQRLCYTQKKKKNFGFPLVDRWVTGYDSNDEGVDRLGEIT
jgi:hypothetical protein